MSSQRPTAETAFVGLGGNLGDVRASFRHALDTLNLSSEVAVSRISRLYETYPMDAIGPNFLNAVAEVRTTLDPQQLLLLLHRIESVAGRSRPFPNAPRTLDLDLLLFGQIVIDEPELKVPHPRIADRLFVLRPLADLDPQLSVPGVGRVSSLISRVSNQAVQEVLW